MISLCFWGNLELEFGVYEGDFTAGFWLLFSLYFGLIFARVLVWKNGWFMDYFGMSLVILSWL